MSERVSKKQYLEDEFKKWSERYQIGFEQEFQLNSMLELQYQFKNTPDDHIKTKRDIMEMIQRIMANLNLKPIMKVANGERQKIMFVVSNGNSIDLIKTIFDMLNIEYLKESRQKNELNIETKNLIIKVVSGNKDMLRGKKADIVFNLKDDKEISELFQGNLIR